MIEQFSRLSDYRLNEIVCVKVLCKLLLKCEGFVLLTSPVSMGDQYKWQTEPFNSRGEHSNIEFSLLHEGNWSHYAPGSVGLPGL